MSEKHEWMIRRGVRQTFRVLKLDDSSVRDLMRVASFEMLGTTNQSESRLRGVDNYS